MADYAARIMPTISTVIIFDFISRWNEFLWPIIVLQDPEKYPLAAALQYLNGSFNYKFGYIAAGAIISVIPVIIVFILCQKKLYRSGQRRRQGLIGGGKDASWIFRLD